MALSTNLISYYKLDSNSNDSVGSNNGTDTGVSYANAGKINNCATYSGSVSSFTDLGVSIVPTTALSVSCWINVVNTSNYQGIICRTDGTSQLTSAEVLRIGSTGTGIVEAQVNIGSTAYTATSTSILANNTWYHVAYTWNGSTGNLKLYINSILESNVTGAIGTLNNPSSTIKRIIGRLGTYTGGLLYNGKVDEVGYFTAEKTADEISQLYNSGRGNTYPLTDTPLLYGGIAYYKLDESSGNANDSIGVFTMTNTGSVTYEVGKISNSARNNNSARKLETTQSNIGLSDSGDASFSMWIRFNSWSVGTASSAYCLDWYPKSGSLKRAILYTQTTAGQFKFYASGNELTVTGLSLGVFYNVIGVRTGNTWEIFVDNISKGTVSVGTSNFSSADTLTILNSGQNPDLNQARSDINIDELGIFTRALNSTERSSIFLGGSGNQYPFSGTLLSQNSSFLQFM